MFSRLRQAFEVYFILFHQDVKWGRANTQPFPPLGTPMERNLTIISAIDKKVDL